MDFKTFNEAKEWGRKNLTRSQWADATADHNSIILCCTPEMYDDYFWEFAEQMLDKFHLDAEVAEVRDALIDAFEAATHHKFVSSFDIY